MRKITKLMAALCLSAGLLFPFSAKAQSINGQVTTSVTPLNHFTEEITVDYVLTRESAKQVSYTLKFDKFPVTAAAPQFLITYPQPQGGDQVVTLKENETEQSGTIETTQELNSALTYNFKIRIPVEGSDAVLADIDWTMPGFTITLDQAKAQESATATTVSIPYTINVIPADRDVTGYTFSAWVGYNGKDSEKTVGQSGIIEVTGLDGGTSYNFYQKFSVVDAEGKSLDGELSGNDRHTVTVKTLGDTPVEPAPTAAIDAAYAFSLDADGNVVMTGSVTVTNPDNVDIESLRVAACTGANRLPDGVDAGAYDRWPNGDIIFGEVTLTNVVNGKNDFTITIPKDMIKQDANTDFWPKYLLTYGDNKTADGGVGPWDVNPSTLGDTPVTPSVEVNISTILASIAKNGDFRRTGPTAGQIPFTFTLADGADLSHVTGFRVWAVTHGEVTKGSVVIAKDLREGVLEVNSLNENSTTDLWIKIEPVMEEGYKCVGVVEAVIGAVDTTSTVTGPGEATNTVNGNVIAAKRDASDNIIWTSPIPEVTENFEGVSGDYIQRGSEGSKWTPNFNYTISNDAAGHIFGEIEFPADEIPQGLSPQIVINRIKYTLTLNGNKAAFSTGDYTYCNGKVVSFLFDLPFAGGRSQTRIFQYTIENCDKTVQSKEFNDLIDWDNAHTTVGTIKQYSVDKEADPADDNCDWAHTACPLSGQGRYWNPDFDYIISNPVVKKESADDEAEADTEVPIHVAVEFSNGTLIPSNFAPQFFVYPLENGEYISEGDGVKRFGPYEMTPVAEVVNMYQGTSGEHNFANGDYKVEFYNAYVSVRAGNGFSNTKGIPYTVDNGRVEHEGELPNLPSGIDSVVGDSDNDAPVEFYNLQGVRVSEPSAGLYIRRQGSKVTKVIIR